MSIIRSRILVIGEAGSIGSFVVSELLKEDVAEVVVYDNFARGKQSYLEEQLKDPRCSLFPIGGDIREMDILNEAMKGKDYVISLAAMWLLHGKDFSRTAFDVNIAGTFNILEACVKNNIKKLIWSSSASVYGVLTAKANTTLENLSTTYSLYSGIYSELASNIELMKIDLLKNTRFYSVYEPAYVPLYPDGGFSISSVLSYVIFGIFFGILWAIGYTGLVIFGILKSRLKKVPL